MADANKLGKRAEPGEGWPPDYRDLAGGVELMILAE
jgi:hypothetical protein